MVKDFLTQEEFLERMNIYAEMSGLDFSKTLALKKSI
jgi:hypothetical protein